MYELRLIFNAQTVNKNYSMDRDNTNYYNHSSNVILSGLCDGGVAIPAIMRQ